MSQVIVVTSGKGGVGKTTTSASISAGIAETGASTVVVDFDIGLRNLDLVMGCERRVVFDIVNVIRGEARLGQALIKDRNQKNLSVLPASQTRDKEALTLNGTKKVIDELKQHFDYVICDSPAGIEKGACMAMYFADQAIVVTNPEISSVRDSDRIIGMLSSKTYRAEQNLPPIQEHLLVTRYKPSEVASGQMLHIKDILDILSIPLLGVIPESIDVLRSSNIGKPVIHQKSSDAGQAYADSVARLIHGTDIPFRFIEAQKVSLIEKIFGFTKNKDKASV